MRITYVFYIGIIVYNTYYYTHNIQYVMMILSSLLCHSYFYLFLRSLLYTKYHYKCLIGITHLIDPHPGVKSLGCREMASSAFLGVSKLFSKVIASVTLLSAMWECSQQKTPHTSNYSFPDDKMNTCYLQKRKNTKRGGIEKSTKKKIKITHKIRANHSWHFKMSSLFSLHAFTYFNIIGIILYILSMFKFFEWVYIFVVL